MRKLAFTPQQHGFHFVNDFINHPIHPAVNVTTSGLCGGMALAAARYWQHRIPVPTHVPSDFPDGSPAGVPPEGSLLQGYLYGCQLESFGPAGIASAANWVTLPWQTLNDQFNWSVAEFPKIVQRIDAGAPVVLGLRRVQGGPMGHQVLAYGYDETDLRVFVYDSNAPNLEKTLRLDQPSAKIVYDGSGNWSSYFITGCRMDGPRPDYVDLGIDAGLTVTGGDRVPSGGPLSIDVVVRNFGARAAHLKNVTISVRGPQGENLDALLGGSDNDAQPIAANGVRHIQRTAPAFGPGTGKYVIGVSYLSEQNASIPVPALRPGTRNEATVQVGDAAPEWLPIGGEFTSGPGVSSWGAGRLDVFARGNDNALWHRTWNGNQWSQNWEQLGTNQISSDPAAVSWGPNRIDVFVRGTNNALYTKFWSGNTWSDYLPLGGEFTSGPAACSWAAGRLDVFARGMDNALWHRAWNGSQWSQSWEQLGNNPIASDPAAVSWGPNRIDVFVRGTNNALYTKFWNGANWSDYLPLGGEFTSGPAVCSRGAGRLDLFGRGMDHALWHRTWDGSQWSADWKQRATNAISSDPAAVSWGPNRIDVFARGTDNQMYTMTSNGAQW